MPSGTTLLGLVAHLTEVERRWFEHRLDGVSDSSDLEGEFRVRPDATVAEVVTAYQARCERSRAIVARHSADDVTVVPAPMFGIGTVEWVMLHMIVETAQHAGHLDILRELTDGSTGFGLDAV